MFIEKLMEWKYVKGIQSCSLGKDYIVYKGCELVVKESLYLWVGNKSKINALIKWWIPFNLVQIQCRWIEKFVTYRFGIEMNCYEKLSFNEKPSKLLLL
jgi:hypothetical protein